MTLGAGGLASSGAIGEGERPVVVTIEPCRLLDTRPAPRTVGDRSSPLGQGETMVVDALGTVGRCTLPGGATGLVANVTAVGATADGYLTLFPAGTERPGTSNLNTVPGGGPEPNLVTVDLSDDGSLAVYNYAGTTDVIVDVLAYTVDHDHDDRYYTRAEVDALVGRDGAGTGSAHLPRRRSLAQPRPRRRGAWRRHLLR